MSDFESSVSEPQDMIESEPDEDNDDLSVTQNSSLPPSQNPDKPDKITRVSAIRRGLKGLDDGLEPRGLLKFWKRGTEEDRNQYFGREDERHNEWMEKEKYSSNRKKQVQIDTQRERARLRKQKSRARRKESRSGGKKKRVRNSGLVKCTYNLIYANQVINVKLADLPTRETTSSIAELTRPARALKKKFKAENKKPQGRKKMKNTDSDAKYHNWFTPLTWSLIEKANRNAGWEMSPSAIVREAKRIDAVIFANLSRTTVIGWIDRSGDTPRWTDSVLERIERGNDSGHKNGGRLGILVRYSHLRSSDTCILI